MSATHLGMVSTVAENEVSFVTPRLIADWLVPSKTLVNLAHNMAITHANVCDWNG
jgi:hypothetical protein